MLDRVSVASVVIQVIAVLVPLIGFAPRIDRWLHMRRIDRLHRALGDIQRELDQRRDAAPSAEREARMHGTRADDAQRAETRTRRTSHTA
jgi:hypothetical protein